MEIYWGTCRSPVQPESKGKVKSMFKWPWEMKPEDVALALLTVGGSEVAKAAYEGGKTIVEGAQEIPQTIQEVKETAEEIGKGVSAATVKATTLIDDLAGFIEALQGMFVIDLHAPRTDDELWDEEVARIKDLRAMEADLVAQLKSLGGSDDTVSLNQYISRPKSWDWLWSTWPGCIGSIGGVGPNEYDDQEVALATLATKILVVRQAIHEILYQEPGVVPETIYNVKEALERFRTLSNLDRGDHGCIRGCHRRDIRDSRRSRNFHKKRLVFKDESVNSVGTEEIRKLEAGWKRIHPLSPSTK